ncbi:MAG TPA: DnaJ domain-containing protein [Polyangiaceae bacterium]
MNSSARATAPVAVEGIDLRSLAIGPREAFVLSRVDGTSSVPQIAAATGLDAASVIGCLDKLHALGAIAYPGEPPRATVVSAPAATPANDGPPSHEPRRVTYDPSELDEDVDLTLDRKHEILEAFYSLEEASHYELLKVSISADKKAIKAAYFRIVNVFHPDRYFGKRLGSFKSKLEQVFARLTEAQEVLTRQQTRDEYDAYLATKRRTSELDGLLSGTGVADEVELAQARIEQAALREPHFAENKLPDFGANAAPEPVRRFRPSQQNLGKLSDPELRKKALARKLRGSGAPPMRTSGAVPIVRPSTEDQAKFRESVETNFKAHYQARLSAAKDQQIRHYLERASAAQANKDPVSAMNALKIAVQLDPDNRGLAERLGQVELEATRSLADSYLQQAEYERREGRMERAARNYEKAALGSGNPALYDRAANCLIDANTDLKRAGTLSRKAVELAPDRSEYRITLARIYAIAKMLNSAVMEAERAVKLAPDDETAKTWLKRIKRGEL